MTMPSAVIILFWGGFGIAYGAALALPEMTRSWRVTLWALFISGAAGWLTMIAAADHGYGRAWIEMPASILIQAIVVIVSLMRIRDRRKKKQP